MMVNSMNDEKKKALLFLVDDEKLNIMLLKRRLEKKGFEIMDAGDGAQAVDQLFNHTERRPDVILMDLMMPVMDGWEATTKLKGDDHTKHIPIIAVSAFRQREEDDNMKLFDGFCGKPVEVDELLVMIDNVIGKAN
tara:strand:+ start:1538 stop:1945 length:408 start_codon:yes stop_codon:yes gene_type:complete